MYEKISSVNIPEDEIKSKECRFSVYVKPPYPDARDLHVTKEIIHTKDGRTLNNLVLEYDRERSFWVEKEGFRKTHKQHKEWEQLSKLRELKTTERHMHHRIGHALGKPWLRDLRACINEPYVYGIDISSTAVVKQSYIDQWSLVTGFSVAELDIEADVEYGTDKPTILSISMPPTHGRPAVCYTYVTKEFIDRTPDFIEQVEEKTQEVLMKVVKNYRAGAEENFKFKPEDYDIDFKCFIVENDMQLWIKAFEQLHIWQPDFLSIWNLKYEMGELLKTCDRYGIDPASFICDPRVPEEYRYFEYIEGKEKKVTASGKVSPVKPAAAWHHVQAPASFFFIDQMCVYKQSRMGEQEEISYGLDAIMEKECGLNKLHNERAAHLLTASLEWHRFMQRHCKVDYTVYNRFDVIGPQLVEEKVRDLGFVMPSMSASSDFRRFPSQPRRTCDALHWYVQKLPIPRIMGVSPTKREDEEFDSEVVDREGWVN